MSPKRNKSAVAIYLAFVLAWAAVFITWAPVCAQGLNQWPEALTARQTGVDFVEVARRFPRFKTLVLTSFTHNLGLSDIQQLADLGAFPQSGGSLGLLGRDWQVLFTRAKDLHRLRASSLTAEVVPLTRFKTCGIYQISFKLVDDEYSGPLGFKISMPRSGFGKELIHQELVLSPSAEHTITKDSAGNNWLELILPEAKKGSQVNCDVAFIYQVDIAALLNHALAMVPLDEAPDLSAQSPARSYLQPSAKITSESPAVISLADDLFGREKAPRKLYQAILAHIKDNLPYDQEKRRLFFGGKMVYSDMSEMYNQPEVTLAAGKAACPSTSVLEAALLRAAGVPARTAGRWGHFYTELFMPGRGWLSTSVTPTGIPLVVDPDHRHQPFAVWNPSVKVQTTTWRGQVKVLLD